MKEDNLIKSNKKRYCSRPFRALHMDPGGNLRVCSWTDATIGNILEETFEDIWMGEKANMVRESVRNQSFEFCRSVSCPCLENDELEWLDEDEFNQKCTVPEKPEHVNAAFDLICNHSCPSCRKNVFVPDDNYKKNIEMISEYAVDLLNSAKSFSTCGNGDLFASPYIMEMLEKVKNIDNECHVTLETNGVLFTPDNWQKIKHLRCTNLTVVVTPNSYEEKTYKYLSGGHDNVMQLKSNLLFMKELREKGEINHLSISIVVQDRNFRELPDFIEKSINEYGADDVVVKPLYKWFCLSEEDYWFKDVLNPLHPYHEEYLEIMKNPIIDNPKVYLWGSRNLHKEMQHPAYAYKLMLAKIENYMKNDRNGEKFNKYLEDKIQKDNDVRIYIYGDNPLSTYFYNQVNTNNSKNVSLMARDIDLVKKFEIVDFKTYEPRSDDTILISDEEKREYIVRDLHLKKFEGEIILLSEVLNAFEDNNKIT